MRHLMALALAAAAWAPAPKVRFVEVAPGVRLEVFNWGGNGRTVVLLAGGGDTAHVYDRFAPKLAREYHVLGITRRGFGASSRPAAGYTADSLADDVLRVLDALKLERPVLAGHSVAGEELSSIGARHSGRIAASVYLHAAWDRTWVPPPDEQRSADFARVGIPAAPKPDPARFDPRKALGAGVRKPDYASIRVQALALYAAPRTWKEMMPDAPEFGDPEQRAAAERVVTHVARTRIHMEDQFRSGVPGGRVVEVPGASHYLFRTHEADVLREIRAFLSQLDR
jgi:non-heme chloroperoxidase